MITGVSRGLGAALFDEFHASGDRILALGRRFTDAQHAAERAEPDRIRLRKTDMADLASLPDAAELASFVADADSVAGTVSTAEVLLVHNAAVFEPFGAVGALSPEPIATAVTVNLTAPILLTNALLAGDPVQAGATDARGASRRVTVVFISSSAAHHISGARSVYSATKRAGETFFACLAAERADTARVRVVIVDPGVMDTEMQAGIRQHARVDPYFPGREPFIDRHERGELPCPSDVARKIIGEHLPCSRTPTGLD